MECPVCKSAMWDNRETKKNPKQPDYKCKNVRCAKAIWIKSNNSTAVSSSTAQTVKLPTVPIKNELMNECCLDNAVKLAMHICKPSGETAGVVMMAEVDAFYKSLLNLLNGNETI